MQLLNWISRSTRIFKTSAILGIAGLSLSSLNALPSDLDSYIAKGMAEWNLPGLGLAVVKDGKVLVSKGYGERRAGSGEPIDGQTLFAIGSTTKAFTCTAIGTLVDEKKVRWDTPVHEIYPAVRFSDPWINREIRVSDLMANHSGLSGVSEHLWYGTDLTRQDILSRLVHVPFEASFRYTFQYRNVAFLFAGELIPQLSGESWERAIENRIFRPLGMNRSYATQVGVEALHNVAQPHIANYDGKPLAISYRNMVNIAPAGSILSCPDDMAKWMIMNLSNGSYGGQQVLQPGTLAFIHRPHTPLNTVGPAGQELSPPAELRG